MRRRQFDGNKSAVALWPWLGCLTKPWRTSAAGRRATLHIWLVGQDGKTGPGVTLKDATLATIGSRLSDAGQQLLGTSQKTGAMSVGGVAHGATDAFYNAVRTALDKGFSVTDGGSSFDTTGNWTVDGKTGYYVPVLLSQYGDTFVLGSANVDGCQHVRVFGENLFGFEDLTAQRGSDFDYNDALVKLTPHS
jgi:hypothetical protein